MSLKETQKVLEENHITECYTDYWSGTSVMFRIPFLVSSAIIKDGTDSKMVAYRFLSKGSWYSKKPRRCYLTSDEGDIGMIEQFFGKDYDRRTADNQYIMLYHQDVLSVN
ncbi:hypothetical protein FAI40_07705 [Acetobacteraceae bacterium]|nr:hypothetical protein FAI40_07705 [Acetobacteraceae bacterium]